METFVAWIIVELNERGWSRSEAARRGGFSASTLDKVIGGFSRPGPTLCQGLARAFNVAPDKVFRLAGLLPQQPEGATSARREVAPSPEIENEERALLGIYRELAPEDRAILLTLANRLSTSC